MVLVPAVPLVASWAEHLDAEGVASTLQPKHVKDDSKWCDALDAALAPGNKALIEALGSRVSADREGGVAVAVDAILRDVATFARAPSDS
jgi:hypothetical protein